MNLSSLKSFTNGSSSICETSNPPEKAFVASKSFCSTLPTFFSSLPCFLLRIYQYANKQRHHNNGCNYGARSGDNYLLLSTGAWRAW